MILKCGKSKKVLNYTVAPKGFSVTAPKVLVKSNVYYKDRSTDKCDEIRWTKVKGATGYKIYREALGKKNNGKKVCIKTIKDVNTTSYLVEVNRNSNEYVRYHVQTYREYNGKTYYGFAGFNINVLE